MNNDKPVKSVEKGIESTLIGIIVSIFLAIIKGAAGVLGNSYALIADAIESTADVFTSIIVLTGLKIASKPRDLNHPYGHGKAEPFAGMIVASALLIAAIIIIVQSIHEIIIPHHAPENFTLFVLVAVVITKELLFRFVIKVGKNIESTSVKNDAWHHRSDAITSLAAFIGISIALIGGKGYETADDYAALLASTIIIFNAYRLFKPAFSEIMDTAPPIHILEEIKTAAAKVNGVMEIDKCFVRKMGLEFFVDIHVVVDRNLPVHVGHLIGHNVKDELMKFNPKISDVLVHIEPTLVKN